MSTRTAEVYLIVKPKGYSSLSARLSSRATKLAADEVAMQVTVVVPDAMFKRPAIKATVEVPAGLVNRPVIDATVADNIKQELQRTLGVDLNIQVIEPEASQS